MRRFHVLSPRPGLCLLVAGLICLTGCKEKARLTQEFAEKQAILAELKVELNGLKETYGKTPSAARGAIPRPNEVYDLHMQVKGLENDIQVLQNHKTAVEAKNAAAKQKVVEYRAKYSNS